MSLVTEINESLEKLSVSTNFDESRKVSVSKNPKLESRKSFGLNRFEHVQSQKSLKETENLSLEKFSVSTISIDSLGDY